MLIQNQIMLELSNIPESKLIALGEIIHYFKLGLKEEGQQNRVPGLLTGKLSDSFFDELSEEELARWE
jgi:hypothetical protein